MNSNQVKSVIASLRDNDVYTCPTMSELADLIEYQQARILRLEDLAGGHLLEYDKKTMKVITNLNFKVVEQQDEIDWLIRHCIEIGEVVKGNADTDYANDSWRSLPPHIQEMIEAKEDE